MLGKTSKFASPAKVLLGISLVRACPSSAISPCISPSTSSHGVLERSSSRAWRILTALGWLLLPKLECDSSAALGRIPKRIISSAAMVVISASCSALGS